MAKHKHRTRPASCDTAPRFAPEARHDHDFSWYFPRCENEKWLTPQQRKRWRRVARQEAGLCYRLRRYYVEGPKYSEPLLAVFESDEDLNAHHLVGRYSEPLVKGGGALRFTVPEFDRLAWLDRIARRRRELPPTTRNEARRRDFEDRELQAACDVALRLLQREYAAFCARSDASSLSGFCVVRREDFSDALGFDWLHVLVEPYRAEREAHWFPSVRALLPAPDPRCAPSTSGHVRVDVEQAVRFLSWNGAPPFSRDAGPRPTANALFPKRLLPGDKVLSQFRTMVAERAQQYRAYLAWRAAREAELRLQEDEGDEDDGGPEEREDPRREQRKFERRWFNLGTLPEGAQRLPGQPDPFVSELARHVGLGTAQVRALLLKYGCTNANKRREPIPLEFFDTEQGRAFWSAAQRERLVRSGLLGSVNPQGHSTTHQQVTECTIKTAKCGAGHRSGGVKR